MRAIIGPRALAALAFTGILTLWVPGRWAYTALQIGLFAAAAQCLFRRGSRVPAVVWLLAATVAWGGVQLVIGSTVYARATLDRVLDWTAWLAASYAASQVFASRASAVRFQKSLAVFGGVLAAVSLVARHTSATSKVFWLFNGEAEGPWMGPFIYENQYAAFIELALPPALLLAFSRTSPMAALALAAVMIASVFVSGSVAGTGILLVETLVVLAILKWRAPLGWRRIGAAVTGLAALVAVFGTVAGWDVLVAELRRREPYEMRRLTALSSIEMAADRPWTGSGLGTWQVVYPAYARFDDGLFDNQAHNDWVQWAAEGGVPMLALMAALAAAMAPGAVRSVWGIGLLFVLAHCVVEYHFQQRPGFGCLYFLVAGIVAGSWRGGNQPQAGRPPIPEDGTSSGRVSGSQGREAG